MRPPSPFPALAVTLGLLIGGLTAHPADAAPGPAAATATYIVQLDPGPAPVLDLLGPAVRGLGGSVDQTFTAAIHGGVVTLPVALAPALQALPGIRTVERDAVVRASQPNPPWGLDRIDERFRPLDASYAFRTTGAGVDAYVIDTGLRFTHRDFGGRAVSGFDAVDGGRADDCNGHGTHVGGTLGGATYGVAKQARLIAVRVLDCQGAGSNARVIAGIDWAIRHHTTRPAVANLSLGGGPSAALDTAVANLLRDRVTVAVAAGNDTADACGYSPARVAGALTVTASDQTDALAGYANGGRCVDLVAPGSGVRSAGRSSDTAVATLSGTSMASPHVAGAAARYLQSHPTAPPGTVAAALLGGATKGQLSGTGPRCTLLVLGCVPATTNTLLYVAPSA